LTFAQKGGDLARMEGLVDQCMADYDREGWTGDTWFDPA
jgi:4-hydroxyphenylacetate 3-monooxygenase